MFSSITRNVTRYQPQTTFSAGRNLTTQSLSAQGRQRMSFMPIIIQQQQRHMSFRNNGFLKTSIGRGVALAAVGGTSLIALVLLGPFILVGVGGLAAVVAFRVWRFQKQMLRSGNEWPEVINSFIQQQQVFSKEKVKVEIEAIKRLELWAHTEEGRNLLIENGIHPERVTEKVSIRGTSFTSTNLNSSDEIKVELDLKNAPNSVLIATANADVEGNISLTDIKLVTFAGNVLRVPLLQSGGGRVIEGEFRDV
ncbi:hypothetical protein BD770DRAFT_396034 [Pilaira anomala]|nr:hypothetical protein BD770DRAFT_396034 [Pilaira anomala]